MTTSVYRTDRTGMTHTLGEVFDSSARAPVYHAYSRTAYGHSYAVCGRRLPSYLTTLALGYLDKFARPCRRCWEPIVSVEGG